LKLFAGSFNFSGGITINALTTSNLPALVQIGTFTLPAQSIYFTTGTITNTNLVFITNRLTFDGTNFFTLPQSYQFSSTGPNVSVLFPATNVSLPVYMAESVSNGQATTITNFSATLQQ
jgi:hypothetical protein